MNIAKSEFSFGRALNRGCAAASGDILLFASAHVYPVYDPYVEHLVSAFDRGGVAIAYGRQVGDERTKFSESRGAPAACEATSAVSLAGSGNTVSLAGPGNKIGTNHRTWQASDL